MTTAQTNNSGLESYFGDYTGPKASNKFMKLERGDNIFRMLDKTTIAFEFWKEDNKPVRSLTPFKALPEDAKRDKDGATVQPKEIWLVPVWNYEEEALQILQVGQKTVQKSIYELTKDSDWSNPMDYDLKVVRTGDGFETKYAVTPKKPAPLTAAIAKEYAEKKEELQKTIDEMFK